MDDDESRQRRLRSFALGGIVGAAGAIATAAGCAARPPAATRARAWRAFEDAPCFLELVEREAQRYRARAEIGGERNE